MRFTSLSNPLLSLFVLLSCALFVSGATAPRATAARATATRAASPATTNRANNEGAAGTANKSASPTTPKVPQTYTQVVTQTVNGARVITTSRTTTRPRSKSNGGKIGKIVGIVIGCIIAVAVLAYIAYVLKKKRDAKRLTSASRGVVGDAEKGEGLERTVTKS